MEMAAIMSEQPAFSAELLTDTIKQHPVLSDKSHPRYKEVEFKKELCMKIAADWGVTARGRCGSKNKWETLAADIEIEKQEGTCVPRKQMPYLSAH
ncbi:hypothetical protein HPB50_022305 [Hyalomma asiaticum]|uniref:Uncharacterized protein n=1 Tax=Hyalomma asiaticum TaxID=266040 RepID=A0ACB7SQ39_HYAAI|nr:hypothetical protein HPB50_022305 [Hyalomma asiaticum]